MRLHNINFLLIQIDEAHSDEWPMYIDLILGVKQVPDQRTFFDRIERANYFINNYNPPFETLIDSWDNTYANLFQSWPDKYYCLDNNMNIIAKSSYHTDGENEAKIIEDCVGLIERLIGSKD